MNLRTIHIAVATMFVFSVSASYGQRADGKSTTSPAAASIAVASSPAFAEILLRKTDLTAELESLLVEYTEEYPRVKEIRFTLSVLQREGDRLNKLKAADWVKLTLALGKLIVRKAELETDAWKLLQNYKEEHPDVKRAKRKVEIYESAIREILG